jgi:hypothetical protein
VDADVVDLGEDVVETEDVAAAVAAVEVARTRRKSGE